MLDKRTVLLGWFLLVLLRASDVHACASCGGGGDDALVLYPNETWKVLIGLGRTSGYQYVQPDGRIGHSAGPDAQDMVAVSMGKAFSRRLALTVTVPYLRNVNVVATRRGFSDPSATLRWTVVAPDFTVPELPQVQLLVGLRYGILGSIYEAQRADLLDVFGAGFDEAKVGCDVWFGMFPIQFGTAFMALFPLPRLVTGSVIQPGAAFRALLTLAYTRVDVGRIWFGLSRDVQSLLKQDGEVQAQSGKIAHNLAGGLDAYVSPMDVIRLSAAQQAAFASANALASLTLQLAYSRAW